MRNLKKWLRWILVVVLVVVGLALVFNEQLKEFTSNLMSEHANNQKIEQVTSTDKKRATFNYSDVQAANIKNLLNALHSDSGVIGKIAVPAVKVHLPIFYGVTDENLMRGAGTMKPHEKMGEVGNYALAGHHMMNSRILFGPLMKVKNGDHIYLTDGKKVYTYRVYSHKIISMYDVKVVNDVPGKKICTLITCSSGVPGVKHRLVVHGKLIHVKRANDRSLAVFVKK